MLEIEIMAEDITPTTKVRITIKDAVIIAGIIISMTASALTYFNILPVRGAENTELKPESQDAATKEYVNDNYVTKEKLQDTVVNLQWQIDEYNKTLQEVKGDVKELLRRSRAK